jgi:hypothetical protein
MAELTCHLTGSYMTSELGVPLASPELMINSWVDLKNERREELADATSLGAVQLL